MKNRSSKSCKSSASPSSVRVIFCALLLVMLCLTSGFARADVQQSTLERRVSAMTPAQLLSKPPAQLVDANRQAAAQYLVRYSRPAWFVWIGFQIFTLLYLWQSGIAARTRDALKRKISSIWGVRFVFGALIALAVQIAALPAEFYDYRILRLMGLSTQPPAGWWTDLLVSTLLEMLVLGAVVALILWAVDRTRLWWIYVMLGAFAASVFLSFIFPLAIEPLFNHFTPLPEGQPLTARIHELARKAGDGGLPIFISDLSRRTKAGNAYVVGIGSSKRIVIGDTVLHVASDDEVLFILAHELGHDVHGDTFRGSLFAGFIFILAATLAVLIADRIGFRRDDDPLSRLTLVGALLGCMYLVFLPVINGYSRGVEAAADTYALQLDPDRVAGTRMFVRFADEDMALLCPGRLARIYWYTHPPIGSRISNANGQPNPCP